MTLSTDEGPADPSRRISPQTAARYLELRLKPERAWYEKRARAAKRWRYGLAAAQIVSTVSIPIANLYAHAVHLSSLLAGVAAVATAFESLFGHREQWLAYRRTARALETLSMQYEIGLPPFDGEDRHDLLVARCEAELASETETWSEGVKSRSGGRGAGIVIGA